MTIIFASDLHQYPDDYEPPSIDHPDPEVMRLAKILMDASPDANGWDYSIRGATQGSSYHEEPYRREIRMYIDMAETVLKEWQPATTDAAIRAFAEAMRKPEVVEAVAKGMWDSAMEAESDSHIPWDECGEFQEFWREDERHQARAAIEAALQAIGATEG